MDCSPPGSFVHRISQARILEWFAISFLRHLPNPGTEPASPALACRFFTAEPVGKPKRNLIRAQFIKEIKAVGYVFPLPYTNWPQGHIQKAYSFPQMKQLY